jgi:ribosomal-protein-alanine N-acetyltransferase
MIRTPEVIETKRLFLRKPRVRDARAVMEAYASDPEATKYLTFPPQFDIGETKRFLRQARVFWNRETVFTWAITLKEEGHLVGMIEARVEGCHLSLGYVLSRHYWNMGYMSEAVAAVTDWGLAQRTIYRIWAVCDIENTASARVLEKVGMVREGILHRWVVLPNRSTIPRDCYCYAKIKTIKNVE